MKRFDKSTVGQVNATRSTLGKLLLECPHGDSAIGNRNFVEVESDRTTESSCEN